MRGLIRVVVAVAMVSGMVLDRSVAMATVTTVAGEGVQSRAAGVFRRGQCVVSAASEPKGLGPLAGLHASSPHLRLGTSRFPANASAVAPAVSGIASGAGMATQVRHPIWLPAVRPAGARTFATLYAMESFARATIASVIPIQAYELLRNEQTRVAALHGRRAGAACR